MNWIRLISSVLNIMKTSVELKQKLLSRKPFLNYNIDDMISHYVHEDCLGRELPYTEVIRWLGTPGSPDEKQAPVIELDKSNQPFQLSQEDDNLTAFRGEALAQLKNSGKMTSNEQVVRLNSVTLSHEKTTLNLQPALYEHQAQSNLVMDWKGPHALSRHAHVATLRAFASIRYPGGKLPPLDQHLLANTIGISVIVLYRHEGRLIPYLPQRVGDAFKDKFRKTGRSSKKVAVFEGGYHCTSSGAARWNPGITFESFFTDEMYRELKEEVGITQDHMEILRPVALCREFLRAGKPQIFFVGISKVDRTELDQLRSEAISRTLDRKMVPEIHNVIKTYESQDDLYQALVKYGLTIEAAANLYYVEDFVQIYE